MTIADTMALSDVVTSVHQGRIDPATRVRDALARIHERDAEIHAWVRVLTDDRVSDPVSDGALSGLTFGAKDVYATDAFETRYGLQQDVGLATQGNATVVQRLIDQGAVLIGKTVTAELATYTPGPTRNPHCLSHTPGGSSSGSAAAVADGHVDFALGTQTAGSVIRPASFCGVVGFKPTHGRYPAGGMLDTCTALDTPGIFTRRLADLLCLDSVLAAVDNDASESSETLRVGIVAGPGMAQAGSVVQDLFARAVSALVQAGFEMRETGWDAFVETIGQLQARLHAGGVARHLGWLCDRSGVDLSEKFRAMVATGAAIDDTEWSRCLEQQSAATAQFTQMMDSYDVLISLSAPGTAPEGLQSTGDPVCNRAWTALGAPCVSVPVTTIEGLPIGFQLIAKQHDDRRLIAHAQRIQAVWQSYFKSLEQESGR